MERPDGPDVTPVLALSQSWPRLGARRAAALRPLRLAPVPKPAHPQARPGDPFRHPAPRPRPRRRPYRAAAGPVAGLGAPSRSADSPASCSGLGSAGSSTGSPTSALSMAFCRQPSPTTSRSPSHGARARIYCDATFLLWDAAMLCGRLLLHASVVAPAFRMPGSASSPSVTPKRGGQSHTVSALTTIHFEHRRLHPRDAAHPALQMELRSLSPARVRSRSACSHSSDHHLQRGVSMQKEYVLGAASLDPLCQHRYSPADRLTTLARRHG